MRKPFLVFFLGLILSSAVLTDRVLSQSVESESVRIFDSVMSPYCPGRTLSACPSDDARKLRDEVTASLASGSSVEAETQKLVTRFGPEILGRPTGRGSVWKGWGTPVLFFALGLAIVLVALRKTSAKRDAGQPIPEGGPDGYRREIEAELQKRLTGQK